MIININKELKKPIYIQIADQIASLIEEGVLTAGSQLPTEKELCDAYEISHSVVLNAYQTLLDKKLIERVKGQGTFVKNDFQIFFTLEELFKSVLDYDRYDSHMVYHDTITNRPIYDIVSDKIKSEYIVLSKQGLAFSLIKIYIDAKIVDQYPYTRIINSLISDGKLNIRSWFQGINIQSPNTFFLNETKSIPGYLITSEMCQEGVVKGVIKAFFHGKLVKVVEPREIIQL